MMQTRFDYDFVRNNSIPGWQDNWKNLLEGRFIVRDNQLVEDCNAHIFRIGFTVAEVEEAIGHTGYTNLEIFWHTFENPGRYELVSGSYKEVDGWAEQYAAQKLAEAKEAKKTDVDTMVAAARAKYFQFDGHNFHPDNTSIVGKTVEMLLGGHEWTVRWKSADKGQDGQAVWITFDAPEFKLFANAYDQHMSLPWSAGCAVKERIDAMSDIAEVEKLEVAL